MSDVLLLLSRIPTEAFPALGRLLTALLAGDKDAAEREARVTTETIVAKRAVHAAYDAGKKAGQ
jgi:hypothetical protein